MWIIIGGAWCAPMLAFWYQAWDVRKPFATLSYLFLSTLSFAAVWLPASWFQPKAFELSGRFYEALGVRRFRAYMVNGDIMNSWIRRSVPGYRYLTGRESTQAFGRQTCENERGHMLMLLSALPATAYAILTSRFKFALYFLMVNIVLNVYPILLQRYTRARIIGILGARENRNWR
jgi:hypothetical protein